MGRPAKAGVAATQSINVRVTPELMARIDEARKGLSRPDWVRLVLQANVTRSEVGGDLYAEQESSRISGEGTLEEPYRVEPDHRHRRGEIAETRSVHGVTQVRNRCACGEIMDWK